MSLLLREFGENLKTIILPNSPISFIMLFFLVGMIVASYIGLEAMARLGAIVIPIAAIGFIAILLGVFPYCDVNNLFPILGKGTNAIFVTGSFRVSVFSDLLLLFLLVPFIKTNKNFKKVGWYSIMSSSVLLLFSALIFILVVPYPTSLESFVPIYQLARLISVGRFFSRIESLFVFVWLIGGFLYLSIGFYFAIHTFKKAFKLEYMKPLIMPFALLIFSFSLMPKSLMSTLKIEGNYLRNYSWTVGLALPLLVLIIASFFKRGEKKNDKKIC